MPRRTNRQHWIDITDILTEKGVEVLKAGQLDLFPFKMGQMLMFDYEGSRTNLKITRLDVRRGRLWAREVKLYDAKDVEIVDNIKVDQFGADDEV